MRIWGKLVAAAVAPLMLGGCLWGPGKFTSNLALNRAGSFVLGYRGEILLQMPDKDSPSLAWDDKFAHCFEDGRTETITDATIVDVAPESDDGSPAYDDGIRQCTAAEIAKKAGGQARRCRKLLHFRSLCSGGASRRTADLTAGIGSVTRLGPTRNNRDRKACGFVGFEPMTP